MIARILLVLAILLFLALWVRAVIDVARRGDLSVLSKVAWGVGMLVLPFIGLLVYTMVRPPDAQIAERTRR